MIIKVGVGVELGVGVLVDFARGAIVVSGTGVATRIGLILGLIPVSIRLMVVMPV